MTYTEQIAEEIKELKSDLWQMVRENPTIEEATMRVMLDALPDPFPDNAFGVKDRGGMLTGWIAVFGTYPDFTATLATHPLAACLRYSADYPVLPYSEIALKSIQGDFSLGLPQSPDFVAHELERDPAKANYVIRESYSGTFEGQYVTVSRTFLVEWLADDWISTPQPWALNG